jgi:hypothetical protein
VSNATVRRLQISAPGWTSISDGQLYPCSYAQLLVLMDASAHGTADLRADRRLTGRPLAATERADRRAAAGKTSLPIFTWPVWVAGWVALCDG